MQFQQQHDYKNNVDIKDNTVENPDGARNIFAEMVSEEKENKVDSFGFINPAVHADEKGTDKSVKQGPTSVSASAVWTCTCRMVNKGNFCPECGSKRPSQCRHTRARAEDTYCPDCGIKLK